jgi:hypothetical protein
MPKERSDQIRQLLDAAQGAESQSRHLVLGLDELAADAEPLDMSPDLLVGVELGRVRRQKKQLKLVGLALDVLPHPCGLLHGVTIDHDEHQIRSTGRQAPQECPEDWSSSGAVVLNETELALGADRREHVEREASAPRCHHGSLTRRCPGRTRVIVRTDACLIGKKHHCALFSGLLLDGRKLFGFPLPHPLGSLLPGQVERFLHRDAQQGHDSADRGQGHGVAELAPD